MLGESRTRLPRTTATAELQHELSGDGRNGLVGLDCRRAPAQAGSSAYSPSVTADPRQVLGSIVGVIWTVAMERTRLFMCESRDSAK